MVELPARIKDMLGRPETVKVLTTTGSDGQPHGIICGSIFVLDAETLAVGEVYLMRTKKNLSENPKAAIIATYGPEAYNIEVTATERVCEGPALDALNERLSKINLSARAFWKFRVEAVYDEGLVAHAGKQVA